MLRFRFPLVRVTGLLIALILFASGAPAQDAVDRLGVPGPISFDGRHYVLAWVSQPSDGYFKQEYVPAGETPQAYTSMLLVEVLTGGAGVKEALAAQVRMLNERKATDPLVNMSMLNNDATGEAILDFLVSGRDGNGGLVVEWNAYRYIPREGGGVTLFGISQRAYGNEEAKAFLTSLKALRPEQIEKVVRHAVPEARPAP
jgi:hypothetical protein